MRALIKHANTGKASASSSASSVHSEIISFILAGPIFHCSHVHSRNFLPLCSLPANNSTVSIGVFDIPEVLFFLCAPVIMMFFLGDALLTVSHI